MKVVISQAVVDSAIGTADVIKLHQLLIFACEGRHVVLFDSAPALEACLNTIEPGTRPIYSEALCQMVRSAVLLPANVGTIRVENTSSPSWEDPSAVLPLDRALATLAEPLGIFVENAENDWYFLCGVLRPSERDRVSRAVNNGWARPLHGGGSTLPAELSRRLANPEQGLRTFVMFDSDRRHPDELASTWEPIAPEACEGFHVQRLINPRLQHRHWMLKRRFIESYMPESELTRTVSANVHPDAIAAFFRMGSHARWYFHMKKGFRGDQPIENSHRCRNLYDGVDAADRLALNEGFGRNLANQYQQAIINEFNWDDETRLEASEALPNLMRIL